MSLIARLLGEVKLSLNENDHNPPHLHCACPEGFFKIFFKDFSVQTIYGNETKARKDLKRAIEWMKLRMEKLYEAWDHRSERGKIGLID